MRLLLVALLPHLVEPAPPPATLPAAVAFKARPEAKPMPMSKSIAKPIATSQNSKPWTWGIASIYCEPQKTAWSNPPKGYRKYRRYDGGWTEHLTAHKTIPLGSLVEVSRLGRTLTVLVVDRGPYVRGRHLDLSPKAFGKLDRMAKGTTLVKYRVVRRGP